MEETLENVEETKTVEETKKGKGKAKQELPPEIPQEEVTVKKTLALTLTSLPGEAKNKIWDTLQSVKSMPYAEIDTVLYILGNKLESIIKEHI
jgi:hypothetical protein